MRRVNTTIVSYYVCSVRRLLRPGNWHRQIYMEKGVLYMVATQNNNPLGLADISHIRHTLCVAHLLCLSIQPCHYPGFLSQVFQYHLLGVCSCIHRTAVSVTERFYVCLTPSPVRGTAVLDASVMSPQTQICWGWDSLLLSCVMPLDTVLSWSY